MHIEFIMISNDSDMNSGDDKSIHIACEVGVFITCIKKFIVRPCMQVKVSSYPSGSLFK